MRFGRTGDHQTSVQQILAQPPHVRLVRELLEPEAVSTRSALARELCQRLDLRDPNGGWRLATTLKALRDLEAQGFWTLPAATVPPPGAWNPTRLHRRVQTPTAVPACVEDVRGLQLIEVTTSAPPWSPWTSRVAWTRRDGPNRSLGTVNWAIPAGPGAW